MKTSTIAKSIAISTALAAALSASVLAQSGPVAGPGMGMGMGPGAGQMGPGARGMRGMRFDQTNTPGWTLMSAEERTANQTKMRAVKTYDECKVVQSEQHAVMETRAKEKNITLNAPRQNGCDVMKARGFIK
ncbi:hypothetical protein [Rhodoferax sp.]|jgi:hypothetical protein|uniref:hypothetical protein n=1 Tax=Rhodoferax sp. TaxID=50421 RepID=UPI0027309383|nr:hypothetical protein [Rhodoferax sp.]MDP1531618.1 hypothetical protein [Rhodoferax sp.]MDP1944175.1 hypothetical protein [Rhodoferax sp.]MDP2441171.1 hypothetical protein [Rhodoferax sp.]MDP3192445.1 hypothetical protein [Rhodoferax sp.]MDP3337567.1 hypothetical protein [Rhodoferax sp.]